jgi:hypothetical protein
MDNPASDVSRRLQKKLTGVLGSFAWLRAVRRQPGNDLETGFEEMTARAAFCTPRFLKANFQIVSAVSLSFIVFSL